MRLIDADKYAYPGDLINEPTVDAVPVVHGRWEEGCWCSVCHHFSLNAYIKEYANYCPNCGAKMDGDE